MITRNDCSASMLCVVELYGLSTDEKPVDVGNASIFYEMDTHKIFMFDKENGIWIEQ